MFFFCRRPSRRTKYLAERRPDKGVKVMKISKEEAEMLATLMLRDQTKAYGKEELEQMIKEIRTNDQKGE